jgi:hypothetical protein
MESEKYGYLFILMKIKKLLRKKDRGSGFRKAEKLLEIWKVLLTGTIHRKILSLKI